MDRTFLLVALAVATAAAPAAAQKPEQPPELGRKFQEAAMAYERNEMDVALKLADEADAIQKDHPAIVNLRGAVALDRGDFKAAEEGFRKALEIEPAFFPAKFNIIEVDFRQGRYTEAREKFAALLKEHPENELIKYRVFLAALLEGDRVGADAVYETIPWPGESAAYYFATAARLLKDGNRGEAESYLRSAEQIFGEARTKLFYDPLEKSGMIPKRKGAVQ